MYEFTRKHAPGSGDSSGAASPLDLMSGQVRGVLLSADRTFLSAALDHVDDTYGSVQNYLAEWAKISRDALARIAARLLV